MARTRRNSTDSIAGVTQLLRNERPSWPKNAPLPEEENRRDEVMARFQTLTELRANQDWTAAELQLLTVVARLAVLRDEAINDMELNGFSVLGGKNMTTMVKNPACDVAQTLGAQVNALLGKLHLLSDVDPRSMAAHAAKARQFDAQNQGRAKTGLDSLLA